MASPRARCCDGLRMLYPNRPSCMSKDRTEPAASRLLPELIFPLLVLLVFAEPLFFRRNFAGRDLLPYHLPTELAIHDSWARGALPVWSAHVSGGRPLLPA